MFVAKREGGEGGEGELLRAQHITQKVDRERNIEKVDEVEVATKKLR